MRSYKRETSGRGESTELPPEDHLYRDGAEGKEKKKFEERYGKRKGDYVYGATVGKVKRERESKGGD